MIIIESSSMVGRNRTFQTAVFRQLQTAECILKLMKDHNQSALQLTKDYDP